MQVKINDIKERQTFPSPGRVVIVQDVYYTANGVYNGMVTIAKSDATKENILKMIQESAAPALDMIGTPHDI